MIRNVSGSAGRVVRLTSRIDHFVTTSKGPANPLPFKTVFPSVKTVAEIWCVKPMEHRQSVPWR
jgi:hypothetical protein